MNDYVENIEKLFSDIAPRYDFLNHLLSLGKDKSWRRFSVERLVSHKGDYFLDLATGTADVALEISGRKKIKQIVAVDFSKIMLKRAKEKIARQKLSRKILLTDAQILKLPFPENSFAGAIIAFGLRNLSDREEGLKEIHRVIKPGGKLVVLEFTRPPNKIFRFFYFFYLSFILPFLGGLISGKREAYEYLSRSIQEFYNQQELKEILEGAGFKEVKFFNLTLGIVAVHEGNK